MNTLISFDLYQKRIHSLERQIATSSAATVALRIKTNPVGEGTAMDMCFDPRHLHPAFFHF
jgi:hypothetical protein